jgi:hypothetical protein
MKNYAQLTDADIQDNREVDKLNKLIDELLEGYAQYMKQYYKERTRYTSKCANQYHRDRIGNA